MADFNDDGIDDLAVLTADGVSIYLGNGKGGFSSPVTDNAGVDPTGLTVADLLGNGQLDLLVGNAYGDVLILVGNGDGTFRPFEPVKQAIALAVADLTGNGVKDFVFADQSLNQVTVVYGSTSQRSTSPQVLGNQATGVLAPGAVLLADLIPNQDGKYLIPDLIVANSGGNNVLVYPELGNGQFGPPVNGTKGFPVGTDPTGLTVADLNGQPDLLVADTGSNDISVLLGQGSGSSWTMIPGARVQTDAGPVALVVGHLLGGTQTDLAVANSGANNVQVFPGVGSGFFNDQTTAIKTYAVGQAPSSLFLGNFNGLGQGLATLNSGSNNGTLISDIGSINPVTQSFPTGGDSPTAGFAGDFTGNGFTDLVVGNNSDGHLALLTGGPGGLSLSQTLSSAEVPNPTALSFGGVSDGLLSFYVSTAGHEAATNLAFNLSAEPGGLEEVGGVPSAVVTPTEGSSAGVLSQATSGSVQQVSQLLSLTGTTLDLAATLLTVSVVEFESGGGASATGGSTGPGQGRGSTQANDSSSGSGDEPSDEAEQESPATVERATAWERLVIGLERSWERARAVILEVDGRSPAAESRKATVPPAAGRQPAAGPTHNQGPDRGPGQTHHAVRGRDGRSALVGGCIIHPEARWHRPSRRCRAGGPGCGSGSRWARLGILGRSGQRPGSGPDPSTGCDGCVSRGSGHEMDAGPKRDPSTTFGLDTSPMRVCSIKRWFQKGDRHLEDSEPVPVLKQLARSYPMVLEGVARPVVTRHVSARLEVPRPNHGLTPVVTASRHLSEPTLRLRVRVA